MSDAYCSNSTAMRTSNDPCISARTGAVRSQQAASSFPAHFFFSSFVCYIPPSPYSFIPLYSLSSGFSIISLSFVFLFPYQSPNFSSIYLLAYTTLLPNFSVYCWNPGAVFSDEASELQGMWVGLRLGLGW